MGITNTKDSLMNAMRGDQEQQIKALLEKNPSLKDDYVNKTCDQTSLCMAAYFGSEVAARVLLDVIFRRFI